MTKYKFRLKKNDERPVDYCVDDNIIQEEGSDDGDSQVISFRVPTKFEEGSEYRINIFSLLEIDNNVLESDPCQARVARIFENSEVTLLTQTQTLAKAKSISRWFWIPLPRGR